MVPLGSGSETSRGRQGKGMRRRERAGTCREGTSRGRATAGKARAGTRSSVLRPGASGGGQELRRAGGSRAEGGARVEGGTGAAEDGSHGGARTGTAEDATDSAEDERGVSHTISVVMLSEEKFDMALQVLGVCLHQMCLFHAFPKDKKLTLFNNKHLLNKL